jgi:hypothetical protein
MANRKKKTSKKTASKKQAPAQATATALPQSADIPQGMKQMGGGYAASWKPEVIGESLHGQISSIPKTVTMKIGRKEVERGVVDVTDMEGNRHALWASAALSDLFEELNSMEDDVIGVEIFVRYDGLGKKKAGQNPPKLFTVAVQE